MNTTVFKHYTVESFQIVDTFSDGQWGTQSRLVIHVDRIRTRIEAERLCRQGERVGSVEYPYMPEWAL